MSDVLHPEVDLPPKRRFMDRNNGTPTLVAVGTRFEGNLSCEGNLSVAGEVRGHGKVQGMLALSESGRWEGSVECAQALVAGRLEGQLTVQGKLEVLASAHIVGEISAQHLAIAEGAVVDADIIVLSVGIERFTEKRNR